MANWSHMPPVSVWNAGKVTSTECKGRQRDPYKQEPLATRTANRTMQQRHKSNTRSTQIQNNSNNLLSTNVLLCFPSCKHQQLLMRHQPLSPRYGSDQQPDLAQGTVCLWKVSELASVFRSWYGVVFLEWHGSHGLQCGKPKSI